MPLRCCIKHFAELFGKMFLNFCIAIQLFNYSHPLEVDYVTLFYFVIGKPHNNVLFVLSCDITILLFKIFTPFLLLLMFS